VIALIRHASAIEFDRLLQYGDWESRLLSDIHNVINIIIYNYDCG